jgi:hypothetical protein
LEKSDILNPEDDHISSDEDDIMKKPNEAIIGTKCLRNKKLRIQEEESKQKQKRHSSYF